MDPIVLGVIVCPVLPGLIIEAARSDVARGIVVELQSSVTGIEFSDLNEDHATN
jgi:hypothetical protein